MTIRDTLRSAVSRAMKERDREALGACRTALAAIDNAEAVPVDESGPGAIELTPVGPGRTDVPRHPLTENEMVGIVLHEVHERRTAAASLADTQAATAQRLSREADLLQSLVDASAG